MKTDLTKKSIKQRSDSGALFSRLSGVGVTGFSNHPLLQEKENTIHEKDNIPLENKTEKIGSFCNNQQDCQKQIHCEPGKCQIAQASIDLWFYLSGPA